MMVAKFCVNIQAGKENRCQKKGGFTLNIELAIRKYLIDHGIKQSFVAEKCGWTRQKTNAIATGKTKITANEYGELCDAVGVPYDYFFKAVQDTA